MKKPIIYLNITDKKLLKSSKVRKWIKATESFINNHPQTRNKFQKIIRDEFQKEMNLMMYGTHIEKKL